MNEFFDTTGKLKVPMHHPFNYWAYMGIDAALMKAKVTLHSGVNESALKYANIMIEKRYPYLMLRSAVVGSRIIYVKNDKSLVLVHKDGYPEICSSEINNHNIAFSWWENKIRIIVNHGIIDGYGVMELLKTLLYYYFEKVNGVAPDMPDVRRIEDTITSNEYEEIISLQMPNANQFDGTGYIEHHQKHQKFMNLSKENRIAGVETPEVIDSFWIDEGDFMDFCKKHDATPASAVFMLFGRAVEHFHPNCNLPLSVMIPYAVRSIYKSPITMTNGASKIGLILSKKARGLSYSEQGTILRGQMILESEPSILSKTVNSLNKANAIIEVLPWWIKKKVLLMAAKLMSCVSSFGITYPGQIKLGSAAKDVENIILDLESSMAVPFISFWAVSGRFCVTYVQPANLYSYLDVFFNELDKLGIRHGIIENRQLQ